MIGRAASFLKAIGPKDDVVVIFNDDADGVSSCVLIKKFLRMKMSRTPYVIPQPMPTEKNLIRKVQTSLPTKIIVLDIAIDQQESVVKKLAGMADVLVIDHHTIAKDLNSERIVHYNPRFADKRIYQSASYCTYKICSTLGDFSAHLWIAATGMIGDYNLDDSQDLVHEIRNAYPMATAERLYDTPLGRIADMVAAVKATKVLSFEQLAEVLDTADGPEAVLGNGTLVEAYKTIQNEMLALTEDAKTHSETHRNIMLYEIRSSYNLASPLSNAVSTTFRDRIVIIYEGSKKRVKISSRNQSGTFNVASLLQKAAKGLDAAAGGHDRAAGASVAPKDWEEFKQRLISLAGKK